MPSSTKEASATRLQSQELADRRIGLSRSEGFTRAYATALVALLPLLAFYFTARAFPGNETIIFLGNRAGPMWFSIMLAACAYQIMRRDVRTIWTPVFWLPAQSAIFFGFGSLVAVFGNDITQRVMNTSFLAITDSELLWANQLSTIGVWSLLLGMFLHMKLAQSAWGQACSDVPNALPTVSPSQVALLFVIFGAILKWGVAFPAQWGMIDVIVPGFLTTVTSIVDVGFAIMAFQLARGNRSMRVALIIFLPMNVLLSGLTFSKNQIIISLLLPILGDLLGRRNLPRFILFTFGLVLLYLFSQTFVHYGRDRILESTGTIWQAGYLERIEIAASYFVQSESAAAIEDSPKSRDFQGWWTRLHYAGVQVAARNLYLAGVPNDSLQNAWMYFVPRLLWPGKPEILGPGWFFYERLTGNTGTFLGLSIYGDLFWLGGWYFTVFGSFAIGWLFAMASLRSVRYIRDRDFLMFPLVLIALKTAILGPTNFVVDSIIAAIPMYLAYNILMNIIVSVLKGVGRNAKPSQDLLRGTAARGHEG